MRGVYLLHFLQRISPAHLCQHYIGYAEDVNRRVAEHRAGGDKAARLCQVAKERGIDFIVVKVWEGGDRKLERKLKNRHGSRLCPLCALRRPTPSIRLDDVPEFAF